MTERSFGQIMRSNCDIDPRANAMEFAGHWHDWAFVAETIDGVAEILKQQGVPEGAQVALICRNQPPFRRGFLRGDLCRMLCGTD